MMPKNGASFEFRPPWQPACAGGPIHRNMRHHRIVEILRQRAGQGAEAAIAPVRSQARWLLMRTSSMSPGDRAGDGNRAGEHMRADARQIRFMNGAQHGREWGRCSVSSGITSRLPDRHSRVIVSPDWMVSTGGILRIENAELDGGAVWPRCDAPPYFRRRAAKARSARHSRTLPPAAPPGGIASATSGSAQHRHIALESSSRLRKAFAGEADVGFAAIGLDPVPIRIAVQLRLSGSASNRKPDLTVAGKARGEGDNQVQHVTGLRAVQHESGYRRGFPAFPGACSSIGLRNAGGGELLAVQSDISSFSRPNTMLAAPRIRSTVSLL